MGPFHRGTLKSYFDVGVAKSGLTMLHTNLGTLRGPNIMLGVWNFMHVGDAAAEVFSTDVVGEHFEQL